MIDLAAVASRLACICSRKGRNGCLPRVVAVRAVAALAALAVLIGGAWDATAYADGGASARSQAAAPGDGGATPQAYAQRILRILADRRANNWVRYWQARADCEAAAYARRGDSPPLDRALIALTAAICARLEARLGVDPGDYLPRGEERTVGLVASEPGAAVGYTLFTGYSNRDVFLVDPLGRVAYVWHLDAPASRVKLLDNGNLLVFRGRGIYEFDTRGNVVWQHRLRGLHHDGLKMPNGNFLLLVRARKTREEAIAAGVNPEFAHEEGLEYDYLLELRPTGARGGDVVWEWSAWDHLVQDFDPSKPNYGVVSEHPELIDLNFPPGSRIPTPIYDWTHINAIDYNSELDQIMLSPRHFSELWIIDHSATTEEARGGSGGNSGMGGDLLYRWGNPRAYGQGGAADQRLFWQHQTHWIAPGLPGAGNVLLFNNGYEFPGDERHYSSVDEIALPVDGYGYRRADGAAYPPDELEWTYVAEPPADFYAPLVSGTQRLPNGNTLIVDGTAGAIFQATPGGRIVWKYVVPLDGRFHLRQGERPSVWRTFSTSLGDPAYWLANAVFRAYWHSPAHPGLQALDLTPGAFIEDLPDIYDRAYAAVIAGAFGERLAGSRFDIYLDKNRDEGGDEYGRSLVYFKQPCAEEDTRAKFFLHIIPTNASDLPASRQEHGFDNLDFRFDGRHAQAPDAWCIAMRALSDYPIERIRTGQFTGEGEVWRADVELGE